VGGGVPGCHTTESCQLKDGTGRLVSDCPIVCMRRLDLCPQQWDDGKLQGKPSVAKGFVAGTAPRRVRGHRRAVKTNSGTVGIQRCEGRGAGKKNNNTKGANTGFFLSPGGKGVPWGMPGSPKGSGGYTLPPGGRGWFSGDPPTRPPPPPLGGGGRAPPTLKKKAAWANSSVGIIARERQKGRISTVRRPGH